MDRTTTLTVIENKLEVIREQFEIIRQYEGRIPAIELDLILSNIRDIYEFLVYIGKQNEALTFGEDVPEMPKAVPSVPKKSVRVKEKPVSAMETESPAESTEAAKPVVFDLFAGPSRSSGAKAKAAPGPREAAEPVPQAAVVVAAPEPEVPVPPTPAVKAFPDIRTFIGINEKFRFINELFDGNLRIYDESIQKLNRTESADDADQILTDLKEVFGWKTGEEAAQLIRKLIFKRFE